MRVGYYHAGPRSLYAEAMVDSVRRVMPDVEVVHLTATATPIALAVLEAYASVDGEWVFVDTDVVFQEDVRHVFEQPFDIAVATREGTFMDGEDGSKFMARMPWNKGVVFSRSRAFWQRAYGRLLGMKSSQQDWMGDQQAMCDVLQSGAFAVLTLPNRYNYPPKFRGEDVRDKAALHFKGNRKAWMLGRAA